MRCLLNFLVLNVLISQTPNVGAGNTCLPSNLYEIECITEYVEDVIKDIPENITSIRFGLLSGVRKGFRQHFKPLMFSNFTKLEVLVVEHDNSKDFLSQSAEIEQGAFQGLIALKYLRISVNLYVERGDVSELVFAPLLSLQVLDLTRTAHLSQTWLPKALRHLPNTTHTVILKNVQTLQVGNWGHTLDLSDIACSMNHTSLQILDLSYNGYADFKTERILDCLMDLREIVMSHNLFGKDSGLESPDTLRMLFHPSLEVFDISHQWDLTASDDTFWKTSQPNWEKKYQSRNVTENHASDTISQLKNKLFSKGITLSDISEAGMKLMSCNQDTFERCSSLVVKYIYNPLTFVWNERTKDDVCNALICLYPEFEKPLCKSILESLLFAFLVQEGCRPDCLFGIEIPLGPYLREIHVQYYGNYQPTWTFRGGLYLTGSYCMQNNGVKYIDLSGFNYYPEETRFLYNNADFKGFSMLEDFNLENNNVRLWNVNILQHFHFLKRIKLSRNQVYVYNDTENLLFANNSELEEIDLSDNLIESIPENEFVHLEKLKILNLANNKLTTSNFTIDIRQSTGLQLVNLSNNNLGGINDLMRRHFDQLNSKPEIDLSNNPLTCTCDDVEFVHWFQRKEFQFTNGEEYECFSGSGKLNLSDSKLLENLEWECDNKGKIIISVVCTALAIGLVVLPFLIYRKRWRIRHALFNLQEWLASCTKRTTDEQTRYEFDAFVIYSDKDRFWVHDVLTKELEDTFGFTLCLHHKNFLPGSWIQDNIEEAIENSRKVLTVLSPNFIASDWCNLELQMTRSRDQNKIVLVLLEEVSARQMPAVISGLLDTRTYVAWQDNKEAKRLFWKKLAKVLYCKNKSASQLHSKKVLVYKKDDVGVATVAMQPEASNVPFRHLMHMPKSSNFKN